MSDRPTSETDPTDTSHTDDTRPRSGPSNTRRTPRPRVTPRGPTSQSDAKSIGHDKDSGQTVGVWGEVDSSDGCGLATPDDARIDGDIESSGGYASTVDGTPTMELGPTGSDGTYTAGGNVIGGYKHNDVQNSAVCVTVSGGGNSGRTSITAGVVTTPTR